MNSGAAPAAFRLTARAILVLTGVLGLAILHWKMADPVGGGRAQCLLTLGTALACGAISALFIGRSVFQPASMGLTLAFYSCALGAAYDAAFRSLRPESEPMLSHLGFFGFYLLAMGVTGLFVKLDAEETRPIPRDFAAFAVLALPALAWGTGATFVISAVYAYLGAWMLYFTLRLSRVAFYRRHVFGMLAAILCALTAASGPTGMAVAQAALPVAMAGLLMGFIDCNGDAT